MPRGDRAEGKNRLASQRSRQFVAEKRFASPFNRATAEAGHATRQRSDAKEFSSVATWRQITSRPIRQIKGVRVSRRFFGDFLCVQKVTRGLGPGRPRRGEPGSGAQGECRRRRQRGQPGLGSPGSHVPKRLASDAPVRSPRKSTTLRNKSTKYYDKESHHGRKAVL